VERERVKLDTSRQQKTSRFIVGARFTKPLWPRKWVPTGFSGSHRKWVPVRWEVAIDIFVDEMAIDISVDEIIEMGGQGGPKDGDQTY
jgi:anaerobic selenocysteine-containing dehydrogenase